MEMKQPGFAILIVLLMLSACSKQDEQVSAADKSPPPVAPVVAEQAKPAPATEAPAPVKVAEPAPSMEKPQAKTAGGVLSHDEGLALAKKSGCLACHKIEGKLVGPAWSDVSKRYKGDPAAKANLVAKVKKGGKGNWTAVTGGVPMPPNSPRVSDADIDKLVTFLLAL
jgi:cytochrome c